MPSTRDFVEHHYRHFNAAALRDASRAYVELLEQGGKMLVSLGGAMSTAEIGITLAEMIRQDKVHMISCTGANLEEDVFNLVAHSHYERIPHYRDLTPQDEQALLERGLNRVTDTCIPEEEAMRRIERALLARWKAAEAAGERKFPHEFFYEVLLSGELEPKYEIDPAHSWLLAAAQKNLPLVVPGWEDSTLGNVFVARVIEGTLKSIDTVRSGLHYMQTLVGHYRELSGGAGIGLFQLGGGISGDFPICVVPMIRQDLRDPVPLWSYFCQVSDSTTSYGSYSGAVPNEKITWEKISPDTPRFVIESDATIVFPLVGQYVLNR